MKNFKLFGMIIAVTFSLTTKAGGFIIGSPTDSLTNQSGVVNFFVTSVPGGYQIITHFNGLPSDTSPATVGMGSKSRRYVGRASSTTYSGIIVLKNGMSHDTMSGTFSFTTSATPTTPSLTGTFIAPNKLRITGNTNHSMYIYSVYGIGMAYNLTSPTILVKAGTVDDTITLSGVSSPNTTYNYLLLSYAGPYVTGAGTVSNPINRGGSSFVTPSVMYSKITENPSALYRDSARVSVTLKIGNQATTATVMMMLYDTFGVNISSTVFTNQSAGIIGKTFTGLNTNSYYTYKVYCYEGVNKTDSVFGNFRTLVPVPKQKKPNLTTMFWTGGAEVSCGEVKLMNLMILMSSTDTVDMFIYKQNMATGFISLVKSIFQVSKSMNTGPISDKQVVGSTDYAYWVESFNRDSSESDSEPWFAKTQSGITPNFKNNPPQTVTSNSVIIPITGDGGCSIGKGLNFYELLPGGSKKLLTMSTSFIPSAGNFSENITIVGLTPCSDYSIVGVFDNGIGPVSGEILKFKTTGCQTSGLTNLEEVWNTGQVEVYDLTGRLVVIDEISKLQVNLSGRGVFILRVQNPETGRFISKKQIF